MPRDSTQIDISQPSRDLKLGTGNRLQQKLGIRTIAVVTLGIAKSNQLGEVPGDY
jgi:hypothetical protein